MTVNQHIAALEPVTEHPHRVRATIETMFTEAQAAAANLMLGALTVEEHLEAQQFIHLVGYLQGCTHLCEFNSEEDRAIIMASVISGLGRLRTIGEFRQRRDAAIAKLMHAP